MKPYSRRKFILSSLALSAAAAARSSARLVSPSYPERPGPAGGIVISTWDFGLKANQEAWKVISGNGPALDAVEQGIRIVEADPDNHSVGIGGFPDRDGHVTLDACIMDPSGRAGSVAFLEDIAHPISLARLVMEQTPHVMLAGEGALQFALENGFEKTDLMTLKSRSAWEEWKKTSQYKPVVNFENHDTIGLICMDKGGDLSGGCSTSGLAYKMHGRVGDSPIIGAALYVDNAVGAAVTTGLGEMVMRSLSSFLTVELMRQGYSPQQACEEAVGRIITKNPEYSENQVGIIALDRAGDTGAFAIQYGFSYAITDNARNQVFQAGYFIK